MILAGVPDLREALAQAEDEELIELLDAFDLAVSGIRPQRGRDSNPRPSGYEPEPAVLLDHVRRVIQSGFRGIEIGWDRLEAGERLTLTVNRRPVADILPHAGDRDPWVPAAELRRIVREAPADPGLLADLAEIRGAELEG